MANTRVRPVIQAIDQTLANLHDTYSLAFAEWDEKPRGIEAKKQQLFLKFWEILIQFSFDKMNELDNYYLAIKESQAFKEYVELFCAELEMAIPELSINKKVLLEKFVGLYHGLAQYRLALNKFSFGAEPDTLNYHVTNLVERDERCLQLIANLRVEAKIAASAQLVDTVNFIVQRINALHYSEEHITRIVHANPKQGAGNAAREIDVLLNKLPVSDELNNMTAALEAAYRDSTHASVQLERRNLCEFIRQLRENRDNLDSLLAAEIQSVEADLSDIDGMVEALSERQEAHDHDVGSIDMLRSMCFFDDNKPATLQTLAKATSEACMLQSSIDMLPITRMVGSNWPLVATKTKTLIDELVTPIQKYVALFNAKLDDPQRSLQIVDDITHDLRTLKATQSQLSKQLAAIKLKYQECRATLASAEDILIKHIENADKAMGVDLKKFLSNHWWKMLMGGGGGVTTSSALAMIMVLDPSKLSIFVAASLVAGTAAGAGIGACHDRFFAKKTNILGEPAAIKQPSARFKRL